MCTISYNGAAFAVKQGYVWEALGDPWHQDALMAGEKGRNSRTISVIWCQSHTASACMNIVPIHYQVHVLLAKTASPSENCTHTHPIDCSTQTEHVHVRNKVNA